MALVAPLLLLPPLALAQSPAMEELRVLGRRDAFNTALGAGTESVLAFDEQVSLNRTAGDWIEQLPGVSLNGQGGLLQSYSIRGFSRFRIRTEIDGVPIITDRRAGNSASFLPPDLLEQIRVDKTASSTLYGSGAMGGVVSLNTRRAESAVVAVSGRSNDEQLSLSALGPIREGLSGGISLRRAEQASDPSGNTLNSGFEQLAGVLGGGGELGDLDLQFSWIPSLGRDIGKSNSLYPDERISSYPEEKHSLSQIELRSGSDWLLRAYHHYQDWDADVERVGERRNLTRYRAHTVGGLLQASTAWLGGQGATGLEWVGRRGVTIDDREFNPSGSLLLQGRVLDGEEDTLGLFIDQRWQLDLLTLSAGARYDRIEQSSQANEVSDGQWSASAGADLLLGESWTVTAEIASGYRFPGLSERYFDGVTPRGEVLGNPDLRPETRQNFELRLDYAPASSPVNAHVALYHSDLEDYIERYSVSEELVSYRNLGNADIQGLEVDITARTGPLQHRVSYQWQEGEDDEGNTLADLNPPGWRYFLAWQAGKRGLYSDLSYRPAREEFGADELPLDSAWIWNARFTQRVAAAWEAELFLSNILDEAYRSTADDVAPLQPGRTVGIRLQWSAGAG